MYLLGLFNGHEKAEEMKILSTNKKNSKDFVIHISRAKLYKSQKNINSNMKIFTHCSDRHKKCNYLMSFEMKCYQIPYFPPI